MNIHPISDQCAQAIVGGFAEQDSPSLDRYVQENAAANALLEIPAQGKIFFTIKVVFFDLRKIAYNKNTRNQVDVYQ